MPELESIDDQLRSQIEAAADEQYSTEPIDRRIALSLYQKGMFQGQIDAGELAIILRNVVYAMFSRHRYAGMKISPVHNVPSMKVSIRNGEAAINYLVHIHKPVVAFLNFRYTLINDAVDVDKKVRLKRGSLRYEERTRRLDLKAKAGLAAVDIKRIALSELQDVSQAIVKTLPYQLEKQAVTGTIERVELYLEGDKLNVLLAGQFEPMPIGS